METSQQFTIKVIEDATASDHEFNSTGIMHMPELEGLDLHPDIAANKPKSKHGSPYLARFDSHDGKGLFTWVKPVSGGIYESTYPLFELV